jgi:hypothetical protein
MSEKPATAKKETNVWGDESNGDFAAATMPEYNITTVTRGAEAANKTPVDVPPSQAQLRTPERKNVTTDQAVLDTLLGDANFGFKEPDRAQNYYGTAGDTDPTAPKPEQVKVAEQIYRSDRTDNLQRVIPTSGSLGGPNEYGETPDDILAADAKFQQGRYDEANPYRITPAQTPEPEPEVAPWMKAAPKREPQQPKSWIKRFFGG